MAVGPWGGSGWSLDWVHLVNAAEKSRGEMFLKTDSFLFLVPGQFFVFFHTV